MDKRKEMKEAFNPEKINFVAVIDSLNWCKEVTPVDLVKAVNNVEGLRGRKRYETNEKSFGLLIKCFEKIVGDFVTTVRMLAEHNPRIGVFFESENIFSLKEDSMKSTT